MSNWCWSKGLSHLGYPVKYVFVLPWLYDEWLVDFCDLFTHILQGCSCSTAILRDVGKINSAPFQYKDFILSIWEIPLLQEIWQSCDRLISTVGFPILVISRVSCQKGPIFHLLQQWNFPYRQDEIFILKWGTVNFTHILQDSGGATLKNQWISALVQIYNITQQCTNHILFHVIYCFCHGSVVQ